MTAVEFEQLQPHEFEQRIEGYNWREENRASDTAYWMQCLTVNVRGKKPLTFKEMLKPFKRAQGTNNRAADTAALREQFKDRLPGGEK